MESFSIMKISMHILRINTVYKPCAKRFEITSYPITLMLEIELTIYANLQEVIEIHNLMK
jgi:hypothetical protein